MKPHTSKTTMSLPLTGKSDFILTKSLDYKGRRNLQLNHDENTRKVEE